MMYFIIFRQFKFARDREFVRERFEKDLEIELESLMFEKELK